MISDLQCIIDQATQSIVKAQRLSDLEQVRATFLGQKSWLTEQLKKLGQLPEKERRQQGQTLNAVKQQILSLLTTHTQLLEAQEVATRLAKENIDVSLRGRGQCMGSVHPITRTRERIEHFFTQAGFERVEGPEIEDDYHNFEALNIPHNHPARALHDTFYLKNGGLLRTHTSPVQIRAMKQANLPLKIIAPGRVYRRDSDITHTPMFHQIEGLWIDESAHFSELKGLVTEFLKRFFEKDDLAIRFRAAYFPFTEPSAEVDIQCVLCDGKGCHVCHGTGWLEILGCGMVHPTVLQKAGLSPVQYQGYAFGLGIDRLALLRYHIPDLRFMFENDLRFLEQF